MEYATVQSLVDTIATLAFIAILSLFFVVLFFGLSLELRRILDRYRLKYGFDRDIELKDMDNPKNLEKRFERFKKRTFTDMEPDKK